MVAEKVGNFAGKLVGAGGFEPPTSCSRSMRANRAALRPEYQKTEIIPKDANVTAMPASTIPMAIAKTAFLNRTPKR